jgi:glucosyl-3-phosphoglycerate synthase
VGPRSFHHAEFPPERLAAAAIPASVCLPARDEARTIGPILDALAPLREAGVVDQIVVVDDSRDGTGDIARARGAEVHPQESLRPDLGPVLGKGDAMWRALSVLRGDVVCFLDADSREFGGHFATGLIGPLLCAPGVSFVKAHYRRPFRVGDVTLPEGGGRVTELMARPLLERFYPELAAVRQPLAGEFAARRELLERLPFTTGYGVEIALLVDAWRAVGVEGLAQVDLDVRQNAHKTLPELAPMADEVLAAAMVRLEREARLSSGGEAPVERPPMARVLAGVR